ncbi:hypothetical protein AOQ84DRAFT_356263 [Glonium stellatum]|uniref:F-box domain-containing protein n=1 Tax=Glonium stellatum TaxID=574774 RepID=A0A8E2JPM2_9PEZI|nr:hypothetical protein AOQ84DRAFT_356263 [Glonium stellatum]
MTSVARHALGTVELLGRVLSNLDFFNLFKAQLVNKTWHDCIAGSKTLQTNCWLCADGLEGSEPPEEPAKRYLSPYGEDTAVCWVGKMSDTYPTFAFPDRIIPNVKKNPILCERFRDVSARGLEDGGYGMWLFDLKSSPARFETVHGDESWRRTFVSQTLFTTLYVCYPSDYGGSPWPCRVLKDAGSIRIGQLFDWLEGISPRGEERPG